MVLRSAVLLIAITAAQGGTWTYGDVRLDATGGWLPANASESSSKVFADAAGGLWMLTSQFTTSRVAAGNASTWCGVWGSNAVGLYRIAVTADGGWTLSATATHGPAPDVAIRAPTVAFVPAANALVVYSGLRVADGPPSTSRGCLNTSWWQVVEPEGVFQPPIADPHHCVTLATETWMLDMATLTWSVIPAADAGQPPLLFSEAVEGLPGNDSPVYVLGMQLVAVEGPPWVVAVLGMAFMVSGPGLLPALTFDPWRRIWALAPVTGEQPCLRTDRSCNYMNSVLGLAFYNPQHYSVVVYGGAPWSVSDGSGGWEGRGGGLAFSARHAQSAGSAPPVL
jgi:hypothetical protein